MKSITIHNLDEPLLARIKEKAQVEGRSMNQTVKVILETAIGMRASSQGRHRSEFEDLFGAWSQADLSEFEKASAEFEKVEREDWR